MPRLLGHGQHRIDYRHVIWSLVRKPGAFAQYRYRDDLFPVAGLPPRLRCAVRQPTAAAPTGTTCGCSTWPPAPPRTRSPPPSSCCWTSGVLPTFDAVRDLVREPVRRPPAGARRRSCSTWASTTGCSAGGHPCLTSPEPTCAACCARLHLPAMADNFADLALKAAKRPPDARGLPGRAGAVRVRPARRSAASPACCGSPGLPAEKTFRTLQLDRFPPLVQQQVERAAPRHVPRRRRQHRRRRQTRAWARATCWRPSAMS